VQPDQLVLVQLGIQEPQDLLVQQELPEQLDLPVQLVQQV